MKKEIKKAEKFSEKSVEKKHLNIQGLFNNNTFVAIFSVLLGIIVWFSIYIDQKPNSNTFVMDVPITINYENSVAKDLGLEILGDPKFLTDVQVNGKKYKITRLKPEDFNAQVSLSNVTEPGEYMLPVQVIRKESDPEYSVISWTTTEVKVKFDKVVSKQFPIEVLAPELSAADGYLMEAPATSVEYITVKGAQAEVSKIARCVINIDTKEELSASFNTSGAVILLDENGEIIKSDELNMDNQEMISVTVPIYKTKTLPLKVEFVNMPKGFPIDDFKYSLSRSSLLIASPSETIENMENITVGPIDFRTLNVGSKISLDIVLKAGFKNVENITDVTVTFPSAGMASKWLDLTNFVPENVPAGYEVQVISKRLKDIKIIGQSSVIKDLTSDDLVGTIDLSQYTSGAGRYNVPVKVYCNGRVFAWAMGEYTADVNMKKKAS